MRRERYRLVRQVVATLMCAMLMAMPCRALALDEVEDDVAAVEVAATDEAIAQDEQQLEEPASEEPAVGEDSADDQVEQEQAAEDQEGVTEEPVEEAVEPADDAAEPTDSAVGEDPAATEDEEETETDEPVEAEDSKPRKSSGTYGDLYFEQSDPNDTSTALIRIYDLTSGEVTYDETTRILTLNNAQIEGYVCLYTSVTLELVGNSYVDGHVYLGDSTDLSIQGDGSLIVNECIDGHYYSSVEGRNVYTGRVAINGGTINSSINCADFAINSGTFEGYVSCSNDVTIASDDTSIGSLYAKSLTMSAGTITGGITVDESVDLSGGTVEGSIRGDYIYDEDGNHVYDEGGYYALKPITVSITGGTVGGNVDAKSLTMNAGAITGYVTVDESVDLSGGTVGGSIRGDYIYDDYGCHVYDEDNYFTYGPITVSITGGTVGGSIDAKSLTMTAGAIKGYVHCTGAVKITGGSITGKEYSKGIEASSFSMTGGTVKLTDCRTGISTSGNVSATGGSLTITRVNRSSDEIEGITSNGTVKIANTASIKGGISAKTVVFSKGVLAGGIDATTTTVSGGTVNGGIDGGRTSDKSGNTIPQGTVTLSGGTTKGRIYCKTLNVRKGATLSITYANDYYKPIECTTLSMTGGKIVFAKFRYGISASKSVTMTGGTISSTGIKDNWQGAISTATFTMKGGTISAPKWNQAVSAKTIIMTKGSISGIVSASGAMKITGGTIAYTGTGSNDSTTVVRAANLAMAGGAIKASKCQAGIDVSSAFTMTKGTVTAANCDYGIRSSQFDNAKTANIKIKGGKIVITNPSHEGISSWNGNILMAGGTVKITGAYENALCAEGTTYRNKRYGGRLVVSGGKLAAVVRNANTSYGGAIYASYGVSNKAGCLAKVVGRVSEGTKFAIGGNTFERTNSGSLRLFSYGSSKTATSFGKIKYGGVVYEVTGVAANAFNTARGKKVTSVNFANNLDYVGANAFKGTAALTTLRLRLCVNEEYYQSGNKYTVKIKKYDSSAAYAKTAFAGAGKNNCNGLTVKISYNNEANASYKTYLRGLGLPAGAKIARYN